MAALEELLKLAKAGKLKGCVFACWFDKPHHAIWTTGKYLEDPVHALAVSARMYAVANQMINEMDHREAAGNGSNGSAKG